MENIALFGGSFDPPHIGHMAIVQALLDFKDIDKVVLMPTFLSPFKSKSHAQAELRLKWLKTIFDSQRNVEVSSYEVDFQKKIPTLQSVRYLLKKYKKIYLVIGADNLDSLDKWTQYDELKELVTFIVSTRNNIPIPDNIFKINVEITVSSTSLRENIDILKLPKRCAQEIKDYYTKGQK